MICHFYAGKKEKGVLKSLAKGVVIIIVVVVIVVVLCAVGIPAVICCCCKSGRSSGKKGLNIGFCRVINIPHFQ